MQVVSKQRSTTVNYQGMMVESHPESKTVAQSCLVRARRLPEAGGFKARRLISMYIGVDQD